MNIVSISDVHIKEPNDFPSQLLIKFLEHEKTQSADVVIFLGDIFDLMVGPYPEYIRRYESIFKAIDKIAAKKRILYFQGNHDFHLYDLFKKQKVFKNLENIELLTSGLTLNVGDKKVYYEHGDDSEVDNFSYKAYKKFINNPLMGVIAKSIANYRFVEFVGTRMSKASREHNQKKYENSISNDEVRSKFRTSSENIYQSKKVDYVVLGHSHEKDTYISSNGFVYLNNGYAPVERCFCYVSETVSELVYL